MKVLHVILYILLLPAFCYGTQVTYYGAAGEVSCSMALLEVGECRCLIDVGSHYGEHPDGGVPTTSVVEPKGETEFPFDIQTLDAVVLTHAHLDHTGRLPELYRKGYRGPIYSTSPTKEILRVMLEMQIRYEAEGVRSPIDEPKAGSYTDQSKTLAFHNNSAQHKGGK